MPRIGNFRSTTSTTYLAISIVALCALYIGKDVRKWTWYQTEQIRYHRDIENAFRWGWYANSEGLRVAYDKLLERRHGDLDYRFKLDYPPLRLLVATTWVTYLKHADPTITQWDNEYLLTWPMLYLNYLMQLATMIVIFFLARHWYLRQSGAGRRTDGQEQLQHRAAWLALLAAMLFWFNPALILNSHGWPQWDSWLLLFFAGSTLLISKDRWTLAGACIGIGCLLKGQILIAAPVFPLIALFEHRWRGAIDFLLGLAGAFLLIILPWLLRDNWSVAYIIAVTLGPTLAAWYLLRGRPGSAHMVRTTALIAFPIAVLSTMLLFETSTSWFHIGIKWGAQRNAIHLIAGPTPNLAELLHYLAAIELHTGYDLLLGFKARFRSLLILLFVLCLILSAARAARFKKNDNALFLVAVAAPWLFMFTVMPHMHERYLVYSAALSASWVVLGPLPAALHLMLAAMAFIPMLHAMLQINPEFAPHLLAQLDAAFPHTAWVVLALAVTVLLLICKRADLSAGAARSSGAAGIRAGRQTTRDATR